MQLTDEQLVKMCIQANEVKYPDEAGMLKQAPVLRKFADLVAASLRAQDDAQPVGVAGNMPGTDGFTMACFKAADVPLGTSLYTHPAPEAAQAWSEHDINTIAATFGADPVELVRAVLRQVTANQAAQAGLNAELHNKLEAIIDVYDDGQRPHEYRSYVEGTFQAVIEEARALLTRASAETVAEPSDKLETPAQVGNTVFGKGVQTRLVIEAAQRHYQFRHNPNDEEKRIAAASDGIARLRDELAANMKATPEEDADGIWPIVNITVNESGEVTAAKLYAPGLPAGNHDVYPVRVPYMDEHTEAWMTVAKTLAEVVPDYSDGSGNAIECAVKAIRRLAAQQQAELVPYDGLTEEFTDEVARLVHDAPGIREAVAGALASCNAYIAPADEQAEPVGDERAAMMFEQWIESVPPLTWEGWGRREAAHAAWLALAAQSDQRAGVAEDVRDGLYVALVEAEDRLRRIGKLISEGHDFIDKGHTLEMWADMAKAALLAAAPTPAAQGGDSHA